MCQKESRDFRLIPFRLPPSPDPEASAHQPLDAVEPNRKRRLWDLDDHAHCPVIGVCMPIPFLRRLLRKCADLSLPDNDYELHCLVVGACKSRNSLAELVQKDLDKRFQLVIAQLARIKSVKALAQHWDQVRHAPQVAGHFWALLSHPKVTDELTQQILGDIHMMQHQIGAANRVEHEQMAALLHENGVLTRSLAKAQSRTQEMAQTFAQTQTRLEQEAMRLRGELITRQTELDRLRQELHELRAAAPDLPTRLTLAKTNQHQQERIQALQRALNVTEKRAQTTAPEPMVADLQTSVNDKPRPDTPPITQADWQQRAVLCVGGRPNVIPIYRQVIEQTGAQFMHHDGGLEDNPCRLDHTLAAADLVICQTGCISHDAYWRVKQHCKRSNKPCLFVETPSKHALERALQQLCEQKDHHERPVIRAPLA